ncbi:hypothetical protein BRARA_A01109 [Brassica rapa]|uniref:Alkyl transferase n=1 Tax=Brassica campestris TaxID=3711 RepID=A0A398AKS3_BRACM|nr:dehydrodolichyl diphosphate synthase 5-like [Brassica napus]RID78265.1 hypothetical protein BRARA_A01109 [Brassica rapa]
MLSLLPIVLTFLVLILIPCLFVSRRLSVPLSFTNIRRLVKIAASQCDEEDERCEKSGTTGKEEKQGRMPKHVAIILDGNRRWAKKLGLTTAEGHEAGVKRVLDLAKDFFTSGVNTVSLFAFSTENWGRPEEEIRNLMSIFEKFIKMKIPDFQSYKIKISVIGNRANIPEPLLVSIREAEEATKSYEERHLIMAIDYSGKFDIIQACKSLAEKAKNGVIQVEEIDENVMDKALLTNCSEFPNPDLMIRTSGEQRISNFFLWQSAYTELYFPTVLWPDFTMADYLKALTWYQKRDRRFGRRV